MSDDAPRNPQLEHLMDLAVENALAAARTSMPGAILSYDADKQSAVVQPLIQGVVVAEDEEVVVKTLAPVHDVTVAHFGGSSGRITVPVKKGDTGMMVFASVSIARWKLRGGIVDPGDPRRHDINDCVFYPGAHSFAAVPTSAPTDAIVTHGMTKIGGPSGTEKTYRADTHLAALDARLAAIEAMIIAINGYAASLVLLGGVFAATSPAATTLNGLTIGVFADAITAYTAAIGTYKSSLAEVL